MTTTYMNPAAQATVPAIGSYSNWVPPVERTTETIGVSGDPAWFLDPAWQLGERDADRDIAARRVRSFDSGEDFLASL